MKKEELTQNEHQTKAHNAIVSLFENKKLSKRTKIKQLASLLETIDMMLDNL